MSDLKTITEAVGLLLRVPSCGTAKRGGMYRKTNTESPYIKRYFDICAGSASGIHTPPLSWHPFEKGTLPP